MLHAGIHRRLFSQFMLLSKLLVKGYNLLLFLFCVSPYAAVFISGRIVVSSFASLGVVTFVVMGQVKDE